MTHAVTVVDHAHGSPSNYTICCDCGYKTHAATLRVAFVFELIQHHFDESRRTFLCSPMP